MLLNLWNCMRGYVVIKVSGFSIERFVNLSVYKNIYIWDLKYLDNSVVMKVSLKGFKLLKSCAKKTGCKIIILKKVGRPFLFFKYRKRKILLLGITFFIFILYFLSSFIWLIEIEGNKIIENKQLLSFIKENGLRIGSFKYKINKKILENQIINYFKDISFINIQIKGTKAIINIKEIIPKKDIIDYKTPTNIVALKDGIILNIFVTRGTPVVKIGDVVSKGDLLVSGEIFAEESETNIVRNYTNSVADVRAKIYYDLNFEIPKKYIEKKYTGRIKNKFKINITNKYINIFNKKEPYLNYDKSISRKQLSLGENYPLPFIIIKERYIEFVPIKKYYTLEQMKDISNEIITNRIITEFNIDTDIINKKIKYKENKNSLKVNCIITSDENISESVLVE